MQEAKALAITMFIIMMGVSVLIVVIYGWAALVLSVIGGFAFLAVCVGIDKVNEHIKEDARADHR